MTVKFGQFWSFLVKLVKIGHFWPEPVILGQIWTGWSRTWSRVVNQSALRLGPGLAGQARLIFAALGRAL